MQKILPLALITALLPLFLAAQSNFKPGYFLNTKGDTVRGFIDIKDWDINPPAISFKQSKTDAQAAHYTVNDINGFGSSSGSIYKKFAVKISMDENNLSRLGNSRDTSSKFETVFLKVLQEGKNVALYAFTDDIKTRFYVAEKLAFSPTELAYRIYNDGNGISATSGKPAEENTFKKTLFTLANKYNVATTSLSRTIETMDYKEGDILDVVTKINQISDEDYKKRYAGKNKISFYAGAALSIVKVSPKDNTTLKEQGATASTSALPAMAFGANLLGNSKTGRLQLVAEVSFSYHQYKSDYDNKATPYIPIRVTYNDFTTNIAPFILYNLYNTDNFKFFLGVGFNVTINAYSNTYYGAQSSKDAYPNSYTFLFNNPSTNFSLKAGVKLNNKWEIFGDYLLPTGDTDTGYLQFYSQRTRIGLNYYFN